MGLEYERVYNAFVAACAPSLFHSVTINTTTKLATVDLNSAIAPASALANELSARFGPALLKRTRLTDDRTNWIWELILHFNQHVSCEAFEQRVVETPIRLDRDADHRQVLFHLRSTKIEHPLQQQPSNGTKAVFTFEVSLSPL